MPDSKINRRRVDMADLMGTDDIPLDEEYFEEKIMEMGDIPAKGTASRARMKKPEEDIASLADGRVALGTTRDDKMSKLFGTDDIRLDDEYFDEKIKEMEENQTPVQEKELTEYEQWIEEGLKYDRGYGTKDTYVGEIPEEKDSYAGSIYEQYDKWQEETTALIRGLKARDSINEARDENIHKAMFFATILNNHGNYSGNRDELVNMFKTAVWYVLTSAAMLGAFYCFGAKGADLMIPWGIGGVIGAIIRYNGKENYTISESLVMGAVEVGILGGLAVTWLLSLLPFVEKDTPMLPVGIVLGGIGALIAEFIKLRKTLARPAKECLHKMIPFAVATVFFVIATIFVTLVFAEMRRASRGV
ncbi:DUF456 domain-containing protein [Ruminococcus albus]|uniref:Uncharacterized protein n=1 Tax=Ruminococcus albus TaxID=1264 RepID=A0A1I1LQY9_RUMAL|nr:DUF456 domain-containing protein [Ruminococcus albus]SFC73348.1 hypothetical protein SAMN02910406_02274 [Ruminococcus albus]